MTGFNRPAVFGTVAATGLDGRRARAQAANTIRIGVLHDQSGPCGVLCAQQAWR